MTTAELPDSTDERPWEALETHLESQDAAAATELLEDLTSEEQRLAFSRLTDDEGAGVLELLDPEDAAEILEHLAPAQAADLVESVRPEAAADIVEQMGDHEGAELLREMEDDESQALLSEIDDPKAAEHLRELTSYEKDTAGALMSDAFVAVSADASVGEVLTQLGDESQDYGKRDVQYIYALDGDGVLSGVLRLRDLVLKGRATPITEILVPPITIPLAASFEEIRNTFEDFPFIGLPVIDEQGRLVGIITQVAVEEAEAHYQTDDYLATSGIVGGEELRNMPMLSRSRRRLAWLAPNIVLNLIAASVIAMYEDTLQAVIALAVFLPIVSDMSGCSGNQAVAVSIRELTLGMIRPNEFLRIVWKEGVLGIINGCILGLLLGTIAGLWKGSLFLGLVIGGALALNTILSVLLGGSVPLLLKRFKIDPALASGPILTTCTDMCGFFLVLNLASLVLDKIS
ncbi:MAG: magnesium transporter [Verrucomicrobiota bacterium]